MFTFYDDELHNLILISGRDIREIISYTSTYDYHPPLQYLVNKLFLNLFGPNELLLALPSLIFILASVIICGRIVYGITRSIKVSIAASAVILINPLILLWGSSIRWYPLWTFLTILSLYFLINHWRSTIPEKKFLYIVVSIFIFALSLYTNYLTIVFLFTGLIAAVMLDAREKSWNRTKMAVTLILGVFLLFIPYLTTFIYHLNNFLFRKEMFADYTGTAPLISGAYFLFTSLFGQSIYPWQITFIVPFFSFIVFLCASVVYMVLAVKK